MVAVSGVADIAADLNVAGAPSGGFASVGARGYIVTEGKWYFEAKLRTTGCMQVGWCDAAYVGHAENGDGVGDGPHSWAYDGWRQYKWHDGHAEWGARWNSGDFLGVMVDMDERTIRFVKYYS